MISAWLYLILCLPLANDDCVTLFEIGQFDGKREDLSASCDYSQDPLYVVGLSSPEKDWPAIHTGPLDLWAGGRPHTYSVCFDLARVPEEGNATLRIDTVDCYLIAPELAIRLNDTLVGTHAIPWGAPFAKPEGYAGFPYSFSVEIPGRYFKEGGNRLDIVSEGGCFLYYDALRLEGAPGFLVAPPAARTYIQSVAAPTLLMEESGRRVQPVVTAIQHFGDPIETTLRITGEKEQKFELGAGRHVIESMVPAVACPTDVTVAVGSIEARVHLLPVRDWEVHLLHFTHLDIGYTHTQAEVEQKQIGYLDQAQALIDESAHLPREARFRWLPEALFAVDGYLQQASPEKRESFLRHARADRISLSASYANELTGLLSDEELYRNLEFAVELREEHGVPIDSLMLTDVPGCTWGMVQAMADCGIRYLSLGPNPNHRIGTTRRWDDRPFYWVSPCGTKRVLCWMTPGYGWFRSGAGDRPVEMFKGSPLLDYLKRLESGGYPYALVNLRYDVEADNGHPDPSLPAAVKTWNETYLSPKLVLSSPHQVFSELERRHGDRLPAVRGDFTPYWEDGAASTAMHTGFNRRAAEKLVQAETLWTLLDTEGYPRERFRDAWRKVVLFDEHTWGSWNSISAPDAPFSQEQAAFKKQLAIDALRRSQELIDGATGGKDGGQVIEVFNTLSWTRSDVVAIDSTAGNIVKDAAGNTVPSQRLSSGKLAFLARDVPALGSARFRLEPGTAVEEGAVRAEGATLTNGLIDVSLDPATGAICSLRMAGSPLEFVDQNAGAGLNEYIYVEGRRAENQRRVDPDTVELRVVDHGPLVGMIEVRSKAPGADALVRFVRIVHGQARVDLVDVVDKQAIREKEGVFFAFPFNVQDGEVRMDMPFAVVRPEKDQIPGSCKNFFAVQRWVDVSCDDHGVTLATIDAPLIQLGAISTDVLDDSGWLEHVEASPTFFSYVMNNYWETNYQADQGGPARFEYSLAPHRGLFNQTWAQRFGWERQQPLVAVAARPDAPPERKSAFTISAPGVVLTSLRATRDGKGWLARLYAASGKPESFSLTVNRGAKSRLYQSGPDEARGSPIADPISLPAYGVITLRIE
ncbi:MAG: polysaccharide lyase family protein [Planctomycetota bacterium]